ncbi:serine hydrolase [Pseudoduganella eburnea]|uniref:Serine hydrolase n=1 Tax=Massilia eburnea TaxID=1776165 RepID=A0A6L6QI76_9BURK|nr:serine hydrolase domain-containing protein [Massilia eburnea]MTW11617.1 serine hydrolase [Massilia eburnea]
MIKLAVALLFGLQAPLYAATQSAALPQLTDKIFNTWAGPDTPGCAVAIGQAGKPVVVRAYGQADLEHHVPNTPETVFEAGSVSKQFTAAAILLLAQDGKLSLSDDVRKYLPELPDYGQRITIDHLLTHTSGLRDWGALVQMSGWPRGTRAVTMDQALALTARQRSLNFQPGTRYSYTNTGYVLAALVVQRVSGKTLAEFTRERMFAPLGMTHTQWRDNFRRVVPDRAIAYSRADAGYEQDMPFEDVIGHGGILTTVSDLMIWNEALTSKRLGAFVAQHFEQIPALPAGQVSVYGHGLSVTNFQGAVQVAHDGSTAGYRTWLGRYPEQGLSIALLCNAGDVNPGTLAHAIAQELLPPSANGAQEQSVPPVSASLAGTFYNTLTGVKVPLAYRDGGLTLPNGTLLRALGGRAFAVKSGTFTFADNDSFIARGPGGDTVRYRRVGDASAPKAYAGLYRNDEVMTTYQVIPDGANLDFRIAYRPDFVFHLAPLGPDTFGGDDIVVRFKRDAKGGVTGASLARERLFDLQFQKLD